MSAALMGRATWTPGITCPEKMTLVALADVSDDHGLAYMLISTLAAKTSLSERGAQKAIASLIEKGLLLRRERYHRSSIFKIVVDKLPLSRPPVSEREMSDDHFWDNLQGERRAPSDQIEGERGAPQGERGAPQGERGAPQGERGAPIYPVETPVLTPDSPTTYGSGTPTLFQSDSREIAPATQPSLPDYVRDGLAKLAEDFPRIQVPRVLNDSRKKGIIARASEVANASKGQINTYQVWDMMFTAIRQDRFLRGEAEPTQRYPNPFSLSVDYLLRPRVFLGILDKAEIYARDYARNHTADGRSIGPTERALRETLASLAVSRQ